MAAPAVTPLDQLIAQYQAAQKPQYDALDMEAQTAQQQGDAQVAGLGVAKNNTFGQIEQGASNKGMYFSGFSPAQQASYTGATYLPALAGVENTVAAARNTVLKGKADLLTSASTSALGQHQTEQSAYDNYMAEMDKLAQQQAFQAQQAALDRRVSTGSASYSGGGSKAKAPTAAQTKKQDMSNTATNLYNHAGKDHHVSQETWNKAYTDWVKEGYSGAEFVKNYQGYVNTKYKGYAGYN